MLLRKGADVNGDFRRKQIEPPLLPAIVFGCNDVVRMLVEHGADVDGVWRPGYVTMNPLSTAAGEGNCEAITILLENGAEIEARLDPDGENRTALHYAAGGSNLDAVKLLVSKGANIHAVSNDGSTPLHYAIGFTEESKLEWVLEFLVQQGVDVEAGTKGGLSAILKAANCEQGAIVEYLYNYRLAHGPSNRNGSRIVVR
jgi:ankyrin repeat protein